MTMILTQERLRELLDYSPETGLFVWKVKPSKRVKHGDVAGTVNNRGYINIQIDGKKYFAHRLAFLWMAGQFPPSEVDHKNGVRTDNMWGNLRPAEHWSNQGNHKGRNGKSGIRGVHWSKKARKWRAQIMFDGRKYHLGYYDNPAIATAAYQGAAQLVFGEFSFHHRERDPK